MKPQYMRWQSHAQAHAVNLSVRPDIPCFPGHSNLRSGVLLQPSAAIPSGPPEELLMSVHPVQLTIRVGDGTQAPRSGDSATVATEPIEIIWARASQPVPRASQL